MAKCEEDRDRYRHPHPRLAYRPNTTDDDEDEPSSAAAATPAVEAAAAAHLFGGSFQFIVQEQAKSMVAIQELQQEVGSLLLFRQAVLAALPHLQSSAKVSNNNIKAIGQQQPQQQSWTRRKQQLLATSSSYRSLQDGDQPAATVATTTNHHNVVDSGFSTEASNSNTSPRSSRFDTASSSEMTMPHPPMEKELLQHLERVQQRLARLKKDEDRLLTLLNRQRPSTQQQQQEAGSDELWLLLEEIQLRSQAIRAVTTKDVVSKPEEQQQQPMSHKKRVSFQQQQLEQQHKTVAAVLPSPPALSESSSSSSRYQPPTRDQVAAILRLTNPVQLQRHLLRALLDNQSLREQVEAGRSDVASRDAQWRSNSQLAGEQMTALRDENEDLRFQVEEQKIELEGTKARLRMLNRSPVTTPALTSIRVRAASTQTEFLRTSSSVRIVQNHSGTQTEQEDNNNKVVISGNGRALPRVIDASPKPKLSKLVDLAGAGGNRGSGSSWGDDEDRPSVERRSYTSRIPTPIKPTVIPIVSSPSPTVVAASSATKVSTPSKRELPDIPLSSKTIHIKSPATPPTATAASTPQLPKTQHRHHHHHGFVSASKSDPAKVRVTVVTAAAQRVRTRLALTDSLSSSDAEHHPPLSEKTEDLYFDSINANSCSSSRQKNSRNSPYQQPQSPIMDSLERSLPEVGINYHYRRVSGQRDNRSYNSQSSAGSSTTPSNSLSFHH